MSETNMPAGIVETTLDALRFDSRNANRGTAQGKDLLRKSLSELGIGRGIVAAEDGTIIGGNHVVDALVEMGVERVIMVPSDGKTLVVTQRTDIKSGSKEFHELAIVDNQASLKNLDFDLAVLASLSAEHDINLADWDMNLDFANPDETTDPEGDALRDTYSPKVGEVIYEPKETDHRPADLFVRDTRFDAEINAITDPVIRDMLQARAAFFSSFNYEKIADYYAYQAEPNQKRLFEKLALVLLDKDQLIENGFSDIVETVKEQNGFSDSDVTATETNEDDDRDA